MLSECIGHVNDWMRTGHGRKDAGKEKPTNAGKQVDDHNAQEANVALHTKSRAELKAEIEENMDDTAMKKVGNNDAVPLVRNALCTFHKERESVSGEWRSGRAARRT